MHFSSSRLICIYVGSWLCLAGQQTVDHEVTAGQLPLSIDVANGRLTAAVRNQPLRFVCDTIARKSGISIVLPDELAEDVVSLNVRSVPLDVAVRDLLANYDTFILYSGSKNAPSAVRSLWVYPKGAASSIRPVPDSDWAGIKELEEALADTNPEAREATYRALLSRSDRRSRSLILDGIRGTRERDPALRERLLSMAIGSDLPFPVEFLTDLARTDPSENIRWMALDTLAYSVSQSAIEQAAQAATTDPSEAVRSRANEILRQGSPRPAPETAASPQR